APGRAGHRRRGARRRGEGARAHGGAQAAPEGRPARGGVRDLAGDRDGPGLPGRRGSRAGCRPRLRPQRRAAVRHVRGLPPRLVVRALPGGHEAPRPLDDLHPHRRHLHALLPAAARGHGPVDRLRPRLGRRRRRRGAAQRGPAPGPVAVRRDLPAARLGRARRPAAAARPWRRRRRRAAAARRAVLLARRPRLRPAAPGPLTSLVRLPRGLPRLHARRLRHPLRGGVVRDLQHRHL
ncbi:MAG: FIG01964566: Predicted membrane protein, hemolysin III homolog, partial [uncultured Frankineae bacterium]